MKKFRRDHPGTVIISHYAESGQRSADITSFMRRCTSELRAQHLNALNPIGLTDFLDLADFETVKEAFQASLCLGACVLVLDGLCHLIGCEDVPTHIVKQLSWLPDDLPPACRLVFSTTPCDISYKFLSGRPDVHIINILPLNSSEKERVLHEWCGSFESCLDSRDEATINTGKLSGLPVYQVILANEIRLRGRTGIGEKLLEACTLARCLFDFWTAVIHTWSQDYNWLKPTSVKSGGLGKTQMSKDRLNNGWIPDTLRLLALSREGEKLAIASFNF